jgi:hypothetical protein
MEVQDGSEEEEQDGCEPEPERRQDPAFVFNRRRSTRTEQLPGRLQTASFFFFLIMFFPHTT